MFDDQSLILSNQTKYALKTWSWLGFIWKCGSDAWVLKMDCNAVNLPITLTLGCHAEWMKNDHLFIRENSQLWKESRKLIQYRTCTNEYVEARYPVGLESNA